MDEALEFVDFAILDPVAAQKMVPGRKLLVGTSTFAQIAAEKAHALRLRQAASPASLAPGITVEQAKFLRDAVMASTAVALPD